jgi:hypothetical protein
MMVGVCIVTMWQMLVVLRGMHPCIHMKLQTRHTTHIPQLSGMRTSQVGLIKGTGWQEDGYNSKV